MANVNPLKLTTDNVSPVQVWGATDTLSTAHGGAGTSLAGTGPGYLKQASTGADVTVGAIAAGDLPTGIDAAKIGGGAVSNTEFSYLDGVTSNIQSQINALGSAGANWVGWGLW